MSYEVATMALCTILPVPNVESLKLEEKITDFVASSFWTTYSSIIFLRFYLYNWSPLT
jgi:hypothetical protein